MRAASLLLLLMVGVVVTPGCGQQQAMMRHDLKRLGLAYHSYHDQHQQGPPGWDELIQFDPQEADSIRRVREAGYQVTWNADFSQLSDGLANTVMAERPDGGMRLMMDGSVRQ